MSIDTCLSCLCAACAQACSCRADAFDQPQTNQQAPLLCTAHLGPCRTDACTCRAGAANNGKDKRTEMEQANACQGQPNRTSLVANSKFLPCRPNWLQGTARTHAHTSGCAVIEVAKLEQRHVQMSTALTCYLSLASPSVSPNIIY